ncbi:MAG TPA: Lon protease family protein, partial [Thermoplasmata archaeon]|nr:Lon protease family protein [Thermoplasmata archaeon]
MSPISNDIADFETTEEIEIPKEPLRRVIGQDRAIEIAHICATQHRHLLLVGPPGTGKSMIAQAMSFYLPVPTEEIRIIHNPENPERPFVEVKTKEDIEEEINYRKDVDGYLLKPQQVPKHVAEELGYLCQNCQTYSSPNQQICPKCNTPKIPRINPSSGNDPFSDLTKMVGGILVTFNQMSGGRNQVQTTENENGKEVVVVYERAGEYIRKLNEKNLEKRRKLKGMKPKKVLIPLKRNPFVLATGASETELLGDVRHDPYGGHPKLGTPPYQRVVPGAIHEAHQGILFIDELPHLGHLQRYILTAMQEKRFTITGRNPQSAGASVKVENVPCDFIFVGACNIQDVHTILSPLRSRILGSGYEVLLETTMEDTYENRNKMIQFVAQEINMDKRIPHATRESVIEIIK